MGGNTTPGQTRNTARGSVRANATHAWPKARRAASGSYKRTRESILLWRDHVHVRMGLVSAAAMVLVISVIILGTLVNTHITALVYPQVLVREVGDPARARERIVEENFTTVEHLTALSEDHSLPDIERLVYAHAPLILRYTNEFPEKRNTPIGVYYTITRSFSGDSTATTIRYFLWFVDEEGGMPIEDRIATFGHSLDREMVYRVSLLGEEVVGAYYQAPGHRQIILDYDGTVRPVFAVASANNNFRIVTDRELTHPTPKLILAPIPHRESPWRPAHDPDYMALAVQEVWEKYRINMQDFVFVELDLPPEPTPVTVSVRIGERWYYLHEQIGGGVIRPGYNQVGVEIGYPVLPADIEEVRIIAYAPDHVDFESIRITIYPRSDVPA